MVERRAASSPCCLRSSSVGNVGSVVANDELGVFGSAADTFMLVTRKPKTHRYLVRDATFSENGEWLRSDKRRIVNDGGP